jgi:hypothetical protein
MIFGFSKGVEWPFVEHDALQVLDGAAEVADVSLQLATLW